MSYQREPYLPGIARAARLARRDTLLFTGCSDYIANQIASVASAKTVYNGVPLNKFTFRESVAEDAPLVFLGRVERIKGAHNAIEIAKQSDRRLIIAGNIPQEPEHQAYFATQVKPFLNERIQYVGPVNDEQKNTLLGEALALVMAIEWNEPFGIVMAEALACGTPILGTPCGAVPEVVTDGVNGFVRNTCQELAGCIGMLTDKFRSASRRECELRFSDEVIAKFYLQTYWDLVG
jgi:glycosyltransferase involved in cell wall biosynthesis